MVTVHGMRLMLLVFAMIGFAGAGAALAVARARLLEEGQRDLGLVAIALMFATFGGLCTFAASGLFGVLALGGVVAWASYVLMARRLGLFQIEARRSPAAEREHRQHHNT